VIPQSNAETKLKDEAIEAQLLAEAMGKKPTEKKVESDSVVKKEEVTEETK